MSEVVIFHEDLQTVDDDALPKPSGKARGTFRKTKAELDEEVTKADALLASLLEMLETPQCARRPVQCKLSTSRYLRRALIPMSPSLRLAGLLPPLDMPHHLRREDDSPFREGVTVAAPEGAEPSTRAWVNVGLNEPIEARSTVEVPLNTRVTVKMPRGGKDGSSKPCSCPLTLSPPRRTASADRVSRSELGLLCPYGQLARERLLRVAVPRSEPAHGLRPHDRHVGAGATDRRGRASDAALSVRLRRDRLR